MTTSIWRDALSPMLASPLNTKAFRCVESQEKSATLALVSNDLEAYELLEGLVENSKPKIPENCTGLHYLFTTPFRYPPLKWGSRFGVRSEPSLMYAGLDIEVTLGECAFYRFVFLGHMTSPPPKPVVTHHTSFSFRVTAERFLKLDTPPMSDYDRLWTDKCHYGEAQLLGSASRKLGFDGIRYVSARLSNHRNIALYSPSFIASKKPNEMVSWTCHINESNCSFLGSDNRAFSFEKWMFTVNGTLPQTA